MSTKPEVERCLVCRLADFRVVRIRKWLHKRILVLSMLGDAVSEAHNNDVIMFLGLAIISWMILYYCQIFNTEEAHIAEKNWMTSLVSLTVGIYD